MIADVQIRETENHLQTEPISLAELVSVLHKGRWIIFFAVIVCAAAAGVAASLAPKTYEAIVVISPVSAGSQLGDAGGLRSQFGGLAALAGISIDGDSKKSESMAILQSEALTQRYLREQDLLPILFASKWDAKQRDWKPMPRDKVPTLWQGNDYFKKRVRSVTTDAKTGLVILKIRWSDPKVAAKWANDLVQRTNEYLRNKAIEESERNIVYLNDQATKSAIVEVKRVIYSILQNEINKAMLARGSEEFAFKVLDPAVPPEKPASPQPVLWVLVAFFTALFTSILMAFVRVAWLKR